MEAIVFFKDSSLKSCVYLKFEVIRWNTSNNTDNTYKLLLLGFVSRVLHAPENYKLHLFLQCVIPISESSFLMEACNVSIGTVSGEAEHGWSGYDKPDLIVNALNKFFDRGFSKLF